MIVRPGENDPLGYLLYELIMTFYDDEIGNKSIVKLCKAVERSEREEKMMRTLIKRLLKFIRGKNLRWIVICDQQNAFYARSVVVDQFPFNIIQYLSAKRKTNIKVVISASANNEGYPIEMKGWDTHDISSHRFVNSEFKEWCEHYWLKDNMKVNHESEEAVDALYWTGGVPYELDLLWKQPSDSLIGQTLVYREERVRDMMESHAKFCDKLPEEMKLNLKECISRMALELSPPVGLVGMDRQLFDIVLDDDNKKVIRALNPIARHALLGFHNVGLLTSFRLVAELVLKGANYSGAMKGKICEMYITTMLELSRRFSFPQREIEIIVQDITNMQNIEINAVVHFSSNKLPPKSSFRSNITTLFVLDSPNYPRFDFFVWDSIRKILIGFQVTVGQPFTDHPRIQNSQDWLTFCYGDMEQTAMELYWIVPRRCAGRNLKRNVDECIIFFEDLVKDFPALGKLELQ